VTRRTLSVLVLALVALSPSPSLAQPAPAGAERVVIITLPGVMWTDISEAQTPAIDSLMVSVANMSARTATRAPNIERGFLTLGAGDPSHIPAGDPMANDAFVATAPHEGGTAGEVVRRRTGREATGEVVQVSFAELQAFQDVRLYGARVGSMGESLKGAGVSRGVVSASDLAIDPDLEEQRRGAVMAIADYGGSVDQGHLDGLLRTNPRAPFGVETEGTAFGRAVRDVLTSSQVVVIDPGETYRADSYIRFLASGEVESMRRAALERADALVARILRETTERDAVILLAPTGPTGRGFDEHLAPLAARGPGLQRDDGLEGWLISPTTRRQGMVVLSDVAPTVLHLLGVEPTDAMVGNVIRAGEVRTDGIGNLERVDSASSVREEFSSQAFWVIGILLAALAILAFVVFLGSSGRLLTPITGVAYFGLALFPAAHIVRALEFWRWNVTGAHVSLYLVAAVLAALAWLVPGPRWKGGVGLLLLTLLFFGSDAAFGGPLQVNGVFGHSPLVAGRFYGLSNPGYAILFSAGILGLTGLAELRGQRRLPLWSVLALVALLPLMGLPTMGAGFGGLLAGVPAVGVAIALGRGWRITWKAVVLLGLAAGAVAMGISLIDLLRPEEARTHMGRFASDVLALDVGAVTTIVVRKAAAVIASLGVTRWTYFIPIGVAVLVLLLLRPRGVLTEALPKRPLLRAGVWGTLVAGAVGFAVNDSGISIPALTMAFIVPSLVLMAVDTVRERKEVSPQSAGVAVPPPAPSPQGSEP
jgi:hypothetical protein